MRKSLASLLVALLFLGLLPVVGPPARMITTATVHVDKETAAVGESIRWWVTDLTDVEGVLNYHFAIYKDDGNVPYSPEPHLPGVIFAWRSIPERTWAPYEPGKYNVIVVIKDHGPDRDTTIYCPSGYTVVSQGNSVDKGDANDDDSIDILDLVSVIDYIVSGTAPVSPFGADANADGVVDILDLVWIIDQIVGG